jgi:hypothetical protein
LASFRQQRLEHRAPVSGQRKPAAGVALKQGFDDYCRDGGQIAEAKARRESGEALTDIGRSHNVSHSTISRL